MKPRLKPHRKYELKEYDSKWEQDFDRKSQILKHIFGRELLEIHHIGSTSIPGMFAKPQIDILILVKDFAKIKSLYERMTQAGFTPRGTEYVGIGDEYFTEDDAQGTRLASVHVFQKGGNRHVRDILSFRDYLRVNREDRDLYASVKRDLYSKHADDYSKYGSGKSELIKEITERAQKWTG